MKRVSSASVPFASSAPAPASEAGAAPHADDEADFAPAPAPGGGRQLPPPVPPAERTRPWVQLKYFTFQPAIFPRLMGEASSDARPGDLVNVYDKGGQPLGIGLYNPRAKMVLRVVAHGADAQLGEAYFETAIRRAVALRRELFRLDETTDAYRVINSDGDGLSGLIVDRYADTLLCEVTSFGMARRLPAWLPLLHELLGTKFARVHVDHDLGSLEGIKPSWFNETNAAAPERVKIREHGIRYEVDFGEGHKTGFFCDQRENRRLLAKFTKGARVLDLCCYSAGFSLNAKVSGGAEDVTAVDLDEAAVAMAKRNANLNQARIKFVHTDAFAYARQMAQNGEQWDVVVLDPPKLIFTREAAGNAEGRRKYEDLNQLALSLVKLGGIFVTCSCSGLLSLEDFEQHVIKGAHRLNRRLQFFERSGPGPDHPVYSNCLESRYLKLLWARVW